MKKWLRQQVADDPVLMVGTDPMQHKVVGDNQIEQGRKFPTDRMVNRTDRLDSS